VDSQITIPSWIAVGIALLVVTLLAGGGYGFKEHKAIKKAYKDSLADRNERIVGLEEDIFNAFNFEGTETVVHDNYYNRYKKEQKLRKDAEAKLFIFNNNSRFYNDSVLSNYKYRRNQ